jgi:transglutaminase-like putative cysteine protease
MEIVLGLEEYLMRSNVVDSARLPKVDVRHSGYEPAFRSQQPLRGRPASKPTLRPAPRRLALAPTEGWSPLLLLAIAIYSVVWSIIAAAWVSHSMVLLWCPAVGLIVGLLVAKLDKLPQTILHIVACLLGHWLSIWLTSVVAFHISWLVLLGSLRMVLTTGVNQAVMPSSDMVFFFYLAFLSFFLGYFGCWLIYRARLPWLVALVYCSIMLVNLNSYGGQDLSFLLITLLGSLMLLIARVQLTNQITRWKRDGLHTDSSWLRGITWRCMQVAGVLTLLALLLSWLLPIQDQSSAGKLFWDSVNTTWTDVLHPGSVNSASGTSTNFFGDSLTISGSVHLPIGDVLYYTSSTGKPYYLEGFTYDRFDGHTWSTSFGTAYAQAFPANASLQLDILRDDYSQVTTNVTVVLPPEGTKHYLFGPAQPTQFDVATYIYSNPTAIVWTQQSALTNGERYQVVSSMPTTDQRTLSSVPLPTNNPDLWNADNNAEMLVTYYQQVPHDLSPNVSSVAKEWTRGATSAYEALKMLESHLSDQNNFTYSVDNPAIPGNVDVVDWLLQNRRGFCTYYASAMVVMARLLGIPARMVNGFSQGHFDTKRKVWVVQGDDAHSWVQAYLPGFGWISFDPTPGFSLRAAPQPMPSPTATRPPTKPHATVTPPVKSTVQPKPRPTVGSHPSSPTTASTVSGVGGNDTALVEISIIALVCSLLLFFVALARYWWRNLFANSTVISGIFWRLCYVASWIGFSPHRWQTPYEYSRMLSHHLPEQAHPLWLLTELFVRDRWAPPQQVPQVHEEAYAQHLWSNLHGIVMRLALKKIKK